MVKYPPGDNMRFSGKRGKHMCGTKKGIIFFLALHILLPCTAGCGRNGKELVRVGGKRFTVGEFKKRLSEVPAYYQGFLSTTEGKRQLLEGMIQEMILIQEARKEGLDKREEVKERIRNLKDQILLEAMIQELRKTRISVSDSEISEYYKKQEGEFLNPEQVRVAHVLVGTMEDAKNVLQKLKDGADFSNLVRQYSMDSMTVSKEIPGDLGYFGRGDMVPEFEKEVFDLKGTGEISGIIKTQFGYHIARLLDRRKVKTKTLEEAKNEIRNLIQKQKFDRIIERYKQEMRVSVDYDLLSKIEIPAAAETEPVKEGEKKTKK